MFTLGSFKRHSYRIQVVCFSFVDRVLKKIFFSINETCFRINKDMKILPPTICDMLRAISQTVNSFSDLPGLFRQILEAGCSLVGQ